MGKAVIYILTTFCICLLLFSLYFLHKMHFTQKLSARLGLSEPGKTDSIDFAAASWEQCVRKIDYDADIVFFGDSITAQSDFQEYFKDVKICNMGYAGDTLFGMKKRVSMISAVNPEKIFVMGGINCLQNNNVKVIIKSYSDLLDLIREVAPDAEIYVQSTLPISLSQENKWFLGTGCTNKTICDFNKELELLAFEKDITYIDLYPLYQVDGYLNPDYTTDGLHIRGHYAPWAAAISQYIKTRQDTNILPRD